jgi:hypothetical protein
MRIKMNRMAALSKTARYPKTYDAMLGFMPPRLRERLTAQDLADVVDALYACSLKSKEIGWSEAEEHHDVSEKIGQPLSQLLA